MESIFVVVNIVLVSALSPLSIGIVRKIKAYFQNRAGASILQPYRDIAKLFQKDEVISRDASWIFMTAPYIVFGTTLAIASALPILSPLLTFPATGDVIVIAYLLAAGTFFLALAGVDVGGTFGGFGASREMMIAALTEGGLILSLVAAAFIAHTTQIAGIAVCVSSFGDTELVPLLIAAGAFSISLLAENARYPVDNPATHLELTMVHEATILEYSGKRLALMEWASANKLFIFLVILVNVLLPWGIAASNEITSLISNTGIFVLKALIALSAIAFTESIMAKFRIFRVPDLLFTSFILGAIAILLIAI
ncbi:NADH-quinone oxidoreductase subunit H [Candidatus Kaiserbacteria bacterium]|nr:NADH-quinone oxidoreductase subunit H [Candidatus Kaiserbacteria bacterium]